RALQWMVAPTDAAGHPQPALAPQVVSASWGALGTGERTAYTAALDHVAAAGIVPVFAAGNDGDRAPTGTIAYPAMLDSVLAVGGVDRSLARHAKSSTGPSPATQLTKPDLVAPVVDVRSTTAGGGFS